MLITPDQIRAARALLRMDQEELARRANVSVVTVRRLEAPDGLCKVAPGTSMKSSVRWKLPARSLSSVACDVAPGHRKRSRRDIRRILAIAETQCCDSRMLPPFTEDDLYDENGLPA